MKRKKTLLFLSIASACCLGAAACMLTPQSIAGAETYDLSVNLFDTRKMSFEEAGKIAESSNYKDSRLGLRLSGDKGAKVILRDTVSGAFDLEFIPESGINEFSVDFSNAAKKEEQFSLVVNLGYSEINAYVESNGEKAGLYYTDYGLIEASTIYNEAGYYTTVPNEYSAIRVRFNPHTMEASVNGKLVWCLKNSVNDRKSVSFSFDSFSKYTVGISYREADGTGSGLLYEINGQPLDSVLLVGEAAPRIFADFSHSIVANRMYKLPAAYAYDVVEGQLDAQSCSVSFVNGPQTLEISDDGYIYPKKAGVYRLKYTVENSLGIEGSESFFIQVLEDYEGSFVYDGDLPQKEIGQYSKVEFPDVVYQSKQLTKSGDLSVTAELYRNGAFIKLFDDISDGFTWYADETGEYTVIFKPNHSYFSADEEVFSFMVTDGLVGYALSEKIKENYPVGERFTIPEATFTTSEGSAKASYSVLAPEGTVYEGFSSFVLEYTGVYMVRYTANVAGKEYYVEKQFLAVVDPARLFTTQGMTTIEKGSYSWNSKYTGLSVDLARNTELIYNNVIDLSSYDYYNDKENALLLRGIIDPQKAFANDMSYFRVVLRDAENPDNFVEINLSNWDESTNDSRAVMRASVNGSVEVGLLWSNGEYTIHRDRLGFVCNSSLSGLPSGSAGGIKPFEIYFDYNTLQVHSALLSATTNKKASLVADLDDVEQFGGAWEGFTSGKVILSMYATGMKYSKSKVLIMNVDGNDFTEGNIKDETSPQIFVDLPQTLPVGVEGMKYPLADGFAYDNIDGAVKLYRELYIVGPNGKWFNMQADGDSFTPLLSGSYVIRYRATDTAGNVSCLDYDLYVEPADYYAEAPLTAVLSAYDTAGRVGEICEIADVKSTYGGSGTISYRRIVTDTTGKEVTVEDNTFRPDVAGTYTVSFFLTDYLGQTVTQSYELNVEPFTDVVFITENLFLPKAFLRGKTVVLPKMGMIDYTDGKNVSVVSATLLDANGVVLGTADESGKITVNCNTDRATVRYICPTNRMKYVDYGNIPVRDIVKTENGQEIIDLAGWFYSESAYTTELTDKALILKTSENGNIISFLNSILADSLALRMNVDTSMPENNFQSFSVYLTDSLDPSIEVKLTVKKDGQNVRLSVNDGTSVAMNGSFTGNSNYTIAINYSPVGYKISDSAQIEVATLTKTTSGKAFNGFTSGKVNVAFGFACTGEVGLCIEKINNQFFNSAIKTDVVGPDIIVENTVGGVYSVGNTISIPNFLVADVLYYSERFVTVKAPSGAIVKDTKGNLLNDCKFSEGQSFVVTESGTYTVTLYGKDEADSPKISLMTKQIVVIDEVAPTIGVDGVPTSVSLGKTVSLPIATVSDNATKQSALSVYVYLIDERGITNLISDYEFTPKKKGIYTIRYLVRDASYNYAYLDFTVKVV